VPIAIATSARTAIPFNVLSSNFRLTPFYLDDTSILPSTLFLRLLKISNSYWANMTVLIGNAVFASNQKSNSSFMTEKKDHFYFLSFVTYMVVS
jgi:hypothetical protein